MHVGLTETAWVVSLLVTYILVVRLRGESLQGLPTVELGPLRELQSEAGTLLGLSKLVKVNVEY